MNKPAIAYRYKGNLYVNLTNRCVMACTYCIKHKWKGRFRGHDLRLTKEPSAAEVIALIGDPKNYGEVIFCGYGEPLLRFAVLRETAVWIKANGGKTRINTTGNFTAERAGPMLKSLSGTIDAVSVSLNAPDAASYALVNRPKYGRRAFRNVTRFIRLAVQYIPETTVTTVALPGTDTEKCRKIAKTLKASFRIRPYLDEYENS